MKNIGRSIITAVPWAMAAAHLVAAPFVAGQSSEGWGYLILTVVTFPAGILFGWLDGCAHDLIFGNPVDPMSGTTWHVSLYKAIRFLIYIGGGTAWFFVIGCGVRWILRQVLVRKQKAR